ncbi:SRPBCC family protein [Aeromicrobium sp. YIM 150415]|uniref:SRPBCC family protein n=1 Tax=Aeromicrobium sp. YIM 150415 TaxID=2803912 RepID=UPI001966785C|nr:SRPBCC family protein [Aeromicrobium sp. YIM 150415]MBM9463690.1 SRPBCC family protein [Aeromicrobium sp. YIM 150415]
MLLKNEFTIDAGVEETWALLTDLERIAPCMPGAVLDGRDGEDYLGGVKIKVGPIGAHFKGTARFAEKDDAAKSAVIAAAGKDPKGQAAANARIAARLESEGEARTRVLIDTELDISGRMAQFGRGAIADVSNRLIGQFTDNLSRELAGGGAATRAEESTARPGAGPAQASAGTGATTTESADAGLDAMSLLVPMVKERYGQAIAGGIAGLVLGWLLWGRKTR